MTVSKCAKEWADAAVAVRGHKSAITTADACRKHLPRDKFWAQVYEYLRTMTVTE